MENVIYVAAPRDWFDYLATGATLLLSVIAVVIAISTARRQNKIALFEKRYAVFRMVRIVSIFAVKLEASSINFTTISNATAHIFRCWVASHEVMLNQIDELRFIRKSILDDVEGGGEIDVEAMNRDTEIIATQVMKDSSILEQAGHLFSEPIRTEIDLLHRRYSALMIALQENYGKSEASQKTITAYKQFLVTCKRFNFNGRLYYEIWSGVSIF